MSYYYSIILTKCCENDFFIPFLIFIIGIIPLAAFITGLITGLFLKNKRTYRQNTSVPILYIFIAMQSLLLAVLLYAMFINP